MEIWNCNCEITVRSAASTKTTQIDECENVTLLFPSRDTIGSIYHATTTGLSLVFTDENMLDGKNIHVVDVDGDEFRRRRMKKTTAAVAESGSTSRVCERRNSNRTRHTWQRRIPNDGKRTQREFRGRSRSESERGEARGK